jgi:hypothetical protein
VPIAVGIAFESGVIKVFDTYIGKSQLFEVTVGRDIAGISSSVIQDEMFLAVLTKEG